VAILALALPLAGVTLAWRQFAKEKPGSLTLVSLVLITLSCLWLIAVLLFGPVIAPDYSQLRDETIDVNVAGVLVAILIAILRQRMRVSLLGPAVLLFLAWLYVAMVSVAI
jgi:hypothetical protein